VLGPQEQRRRYGRQGLRRDTLQRFSLEWCPTCEKTQKMIFDVLPAVGKNAHDAADIVCDHCKSIIATLHAHRAQQVSTRHKRAAKAREMAGQALDRLIDPSASDEEQHTRKRRLLKGPKEFRDIRDKGADKRTVPPELTHPAGDGHSQLGGAWQESVL
jgi:glutaredoxin